MDKPSTENSAKNGVKPFLRWAGGKTWLIKHLESFLPEHFNNYHEPFLGSGSIFFWLKKGSKLTGKVFLSDSNKELISCYSQIKNNVEEVIQQLTQYKNTKNFYYKLRDKQPSNSIENAARFIYLNRTSYNGLYRVNLKGEYNVPYGNKQYQTLFDFHNFRQASFLLSDTDIKHHDFQDSLRSIEKGDLVFLDPPYTVAHGHNGFIKYNQKIFAWEDQKRLATYIEALKSIGAFFILTNAAHPSITDLFSNYGIRYELNRSSVMGGKKATRGLVSEYVFSNTVRPEGIQIL